LDRTITDRDIASAPGVHVDKELDGFIERRDVQRRKEEGERPAEAAWRASEKAQEAARREEMRLAWGEYHAEQARRHRAALGSLIAHHEEQAEKYGEPRGAA
jgi:hypothetical protein